MSAYEQAWKKDFGREILKGFKIFKIRQHISKNDMEHLVRILADPKVRETIASKGDMDRPSHLIASLLLNPRMVPAWYLAGRALLQSKHKK